jgi:hypothetical protein
MLNNTLNKPTIFEQEETGPTGVIKISDLPTTTITSSQSQGPTGVIKISDLPAAAPVAADAVSTKGISGVVRISDLPAGSVSSPIEEPAQTPPVGIVRIADLPSGGNVKDAQLKSVGIDTGIAPRVVNTDKRRTNPPTINPTTQRYEVDDWSLDAIKWKESNFGDPNFLMSPKGAAGPYQIMPETASQPGFGVKPLVVTGDPATDERYDEDKARAFAKSYYEAMLNRYDGDAEAALAAYNWGVGSADKWVAGGKDMSKLPSETRGYVETLAPTQNSIPFAVRAEEAPVIAQANEGIKAVISGFFDQFEDEALQDDFRVKGMYAGLTPSKAPDDSFFTAFVESMKRGLAQQVLPSMGQILVLAADEIKYASEIVAKAVAAPFAAAGNDQVVQGIASVSRATKALAEGGKQVLAGAIFDFANSIPYEQRRIGEIEAFGQVLDEIANRPDQAALRFATTVGEGLPVVLGGILVALTTKGRGLMPYMFSLEAGAFDREIMFLKEAGVEVSDEERFILSNVVGMTNAVIEKWGFGKMMDPMKAPGLKQKLLKTMLTVPYNGIEETLQGISSTLGEMYLIDEIPDDIPKRILNDFYAGASLGLSVGSAGALTSSMLNRNQPDTEYLGTEMENGEIVSRFRVLALGPDNGKIMTNKEIVDAGYKRDGVYARDQYKISFMNNIQDITPEAADALVNVLEARARTTGMSLMEFYEKTGFDIKQDPNAVASGVATDALGRMTMRINQATTFGEYVDAMSDMLAETMTEKEAKLLSKRLGVDAKDKLEVSDFFSNAFKEYLMRNFDPDIASEYSGKVTRSTSKKYIEAAGSFSTLFEFVTDHLTTTLSSGMPLSKAQYDFMDNVFSGIDGKGIGKKEVMRKGLIARVLDSVAVKTEFRRYGMEQTGYNVRNYYSTIDYAVSEAADTASSVQRNLESKGFKSPDQAKEIKSEAILVAESKLKFAELDGKVKAGTATTREQAIHDTAIVYKKYMYAWKQRLQNANVLSQRHGDYHREKIAQKIKDLLSDPNVQPPDAAKLNKLLTRLAEAYDVEFVHIPLQAWFDNIKTHDVQKFERALSFLTDKKRATTKIADLIENGVLEISDLDADAMLGSYAQRVGQDLAFGRIRDAAVREGAAARLKRPNGAYEKRYNDEPPIGLFREYDVHPVLNNWLHVMARTDQVGVFKRWVSTAKFFTFADPFLLASYNVIQLALVGAMSVSSPIKGARAVYQGVSDYLTRSDEFRRAQELGVTSQSFRSPFSSIVEDVQDAGLGKRGAKRSYTRAAIGAVAGGLATAAVTGGAGAFLGMGAGAALAFPKLKTYIRAATKHSTLGKSLLSMGVTPLRQVYAALNNFAWGFDHLTRQIAYRKLLNDGLSEKDAAALASQIFGDYADVPIGTRNTLNTFLYTPTYKIAMFKLFGESIRNIPRVISGTASSAQQASAMVAVNLLGFVLAVDFFFTGVLGWERDQFGRRYLMRRQTHAGPKDIVMVFAGPHDLLTKYINRIDTALDPSVDNALSKFVELNKWEITPLLRVTYESIQGQKDNQAIYSPHDSADIKAAKITNHFISSIIGAYSNFTQNEFNPQGTEAFIREYGNMKYALSQVFLTVYSRDPRKLSLAKAAERRMDNLERDLGLTAIADMYRTGAAYQFPDQLAELVEQAKPRIAEFQRKQGLTIQKMEEEWYDPAAYKELRDPNGQVVKMEDRIEQMFGEMIKFLGLLPNFEDEIDEEE